MRDIDAQERDAAASPTGISTESILAFLSTPEAYPEPPQEVQVTETHHSWIFLSGDYVYKLKKPLQHLFADLSTADGRRRNAYEELRLNRRLSPNYYLDVVPLVFGDGRLALGGQGLEIDSLVKMVRLPAERMLDRLLVSQDPERIDVESAADLLCDFYRRCEPETLSPQGYRQSFVVNCTSAMALLVERPESGIADRAPALIDTLRRFIETRGEILEERVAQSRIVEGHGDLRPEHICLTTPPAVFDCLEFQRDLRVVDPLAEFAFLALECERLGAASVGARALALYCKRLGDDALESLVHFYKAEAALTRAKLAARHLEEPGRRGAQHWVARTHRYLDFVERYARRLAFSSIGSAKY